MLTPFLKLILDKNIKGMDCIKQVLASSFKVWYNKHVVNKLKELKNYARVQIRKNMFW